MNIRHQDYMNKNKRELSFERLVPKEQGFENIDMELMHKKLKTIKTVYRQELPKITKSKKTGVRTDNSYKPKLVWFEFQYHSCA
jgi:hypothetical protein